MKEGKIDSLMQENQVKLNALGKDFPLHITLTTCLNLTAHSYFYRYRFNNSWSLVLTLESF